MDNSMVIISGQVVQTAKKYTAESYYTHCHMFHLKVMEDVIAVYMANRDFFLLPDAVRGVLQGTDRNQNSKKIKVFGSMESENTSGRMRLVAWGIKFDDKAGENEKEKNNRLRVEGYLCESYLLAGKTYVVIGLLRKRSFTRLSGIIQSAVDVVCGERYLLNGYVKPVDQIYVYPVFDAPESRSG